MRQEQRYRVVCALQKVGTQHYNAGKKKASLPPLKFHYKNTVAVHTAVAVGTIDYTVKLLLLYVP